MPPKPKSATSSKPTRKRNFTLAELRNLIGIARDVQPISMNEWETVRLRHQLAFPDQDRLAAALRRKFNSLFKTAPPTGNPSCPDYIREAYRVRRMIVDKTEGSDGGSDIDPDGDLFGDGLLDSEDEDRDEVGDDEAAEEANEEGGADAGVDLFGDGSGGDVEIVVRDQEPGPGWDVHISDPPSARGSGFVPTVHGGGKGGRALTVGGDGRKSGSLSASAGRKAAARRSIEASSDDEQIGAPKRKPKKMSRKDTNAEVAAKAHSEDEDEFGSKKPPTKKG